MALDFFGKPNGAGITGGGPGDSQFYAQLFRSFDPQNVGCVQGGQVFGFFMSSGLNKAALGDVWDEATQKQTGGLTLAKFVDAMRLIALAQKGVPPKRANIQQHLPLPIAHLKYPAHIQPPPPSAAAAATANGVETQEAAEPDPFGDLASGVASGLGFEIGGTGAADASASTLSSSTKPTGPRWETDVVGAGGAGGNDVAASAAVFDSPNMTASMSPTDMGGVGGGSAFGGGAFGGGGGMNGVALNEYGPPPSHGKQLTVTMTTAPTTTATTTDSYSVPGSADMMAMPSMEMGGMPTMGIPMPPTATSATSGVPPLSRRISSSNMLYKEERLRETIRVAEQRELLAKKQANLQRIENEKLTAENEKLKMEIMGARQAQGEALKQSSDALGSIQPLRVENDKLKQAIAQWKELIQTKDEELETLETEVDQLRAENERLENAVGDQRAKSDDLQLRMERTDAALLDVRKKHGESEERVQVLRAETSRLEEDKRELELRVAQIKDEMKRLKRAQNSGLGFSDTQTLKKKEASLFNINALSFDAADASNTNNNGDGATDTAQSDDDTTAAVPPGNHDFNFTTDTTPAPPPAYAAAVAPASATAAIHDSNDDDDDGDGDDDDNAEPAMIEREVEEKVEVEEDVTQTVLIDEEYKSSEWYMSAQDIKNYHKFFVQADTNKDGVVDGNEAFKFFTKSKLNRKVLAKIWTLADQDKKGKLSEALFCVMFHIVFKIKKSNQRLQVPQQVPACLTVDVVAKLGTKVTRTVKQKQWVTKTRIVKVPNPNRKHNNAAKSKKSNKNKNKNKKQKKSDEPDLFATATSTATANNNNHAMDDDFATDWGNDFAFDATETPGNDNNTQAATAAAASTTPPTHTEMDNGGASKQIEFENNGNDENGQAW
eukprot:CAMPEP_0202695512 /NCGR_PEP_ID=MMETSP1385-20130828/9093_1 /ASSEMBLY_ACC=CAM_ASM_000861 /TAXON_ID=933848 /ORGANISM="Elphidium margaritaceum" /LENGTH=891 /DNA_ID=CAMNT_0049351553 /DNA_START=69 /DNA_END=2741 /DNA_ORIENTATION=-